ncbi:MAG: hypothetical protein L6Q84_27015 [Polyangiaceae bacterium]|nr:hypothetical protein [Polyangiaceae bacterium]
MSRSLATALIAVGALVALRTFGSCSSPPEAPSGAADAAADQGTDGDAGAPDSPADAPADHATPPWDPVWHETKPASFQVVPAGPRRAKGCGPACKVIAETDPEGTGERRPRANDDWAVFQVVPGGRVHAVHLATGTEYVVDDGKGWPEGVGAGGGPSVSKELIFYGVSTWWGGMMILRSLTTGEAKVVWSREGNGGTMTTSFSDPYLYWAHGPPELLYRFDFRNGAIRSVPDGGCIILEGASNGLATCAGEGFVDLIDFDAGTAKKLSKSAYADIAGSISPDGKTAAWIDTRDPAANGKHSTWLDPYGGEVYTKDLLTGVETRVTWDSPQKPAVKTFPRFVAGRLVWQSWAGMDGGGPQSQDLWQTASPLWHTVDGGKPVALAGSDRRFTFPQPATIGVVATLYELADGAAAQSSLVLLDWPTGAEGG